jgi:hypothetical protein
MITGMPVRNTSPAAVDPSMDYVLADRHLVDVPSNRDRALVAGHIVDPRRLGPVQQHTHHTLAHRRMTDPS